MVEHVNERGDQDEGEHYQCMISVNRFEESVKEKPAEKPGNHHDPATGNPEAETGLRRDDVG